MVGVVQLKPLLPPVAYDKPRPQQLTGVSSSSVPKPIPSYSSVSPSPRRPVEMVVPSDQREPCMWDVSTCVINITQVTLTGHAAVSIDLFFVVFRLRRLLPICLSLDSWRCGWSTYSDTLKGWYWAWKSNLFLMLSSSVFSHFSFLFFSFRQCVDSRTIYSTTESFLWFCFCLSDECLDCVLPTYLQPTMRHLSATRNSVSSAHPSYYYYYYYHYIIIIDAMS